MKWADQVKRQPVWLDSLEKRFDLPDCMELGQPSFIILSQLSKRAGHIP